MFYFKLIFTNPCILESGLTVAPFAMKEWFHNHTKFNAWYNGHTVIFRAINNPEDCIESSPVINVESATAYYKLYTRDAVINIWDEGKAEAARATENSLTLKPFPVPAPAKTKISHVEVKLSEWDKAKITEKALGGYVLGTYKPTAGKPFGFIQTNYGDIFAYGLGNTEIEIIFDFIETPKGMKVSEWRKPTSEDYNKIAQAIENERVRRQVERDQFEKDYCERQDQKNIEAWKKEKSFFEQYGFYCQHVSSDSKNNYGCAKWENYTFSREITDKEFVAYLKAIGANLIPETVDAPVCQGSISLYRDGYSWATSGTSVNWTRYERKVYYD